MTKQDVKQAFKDIGCIIKIKKVSLFGNQWYQIISGVDAIDKGNVVTRELYENNITFFKLRHTFNKVVLDDGLKIIV